MTQELNELSSIIEFDLPPIPNCKKFKNHVTPEQIAVLKVKQGIEMSESDRNALLEAIEFYKVALPKLKSINLTTITIEQAESITQYLICVFNQLYVQQRPYQFHFLYRVTIVNDNDRIKGKIRNPNLLSYPPLKKIQELKWYNRCSTYEKTLFYASFYENVALMEMQPKVDEKIIISEWQNSQPNRKFMFAEIPNCSVENSSAKIAKSAYNDSIAQKDLLFQELVNLTTEFIASEFTKSIHNNNQKRNSNRLEYLYSAFVGNRLLSMPPIAPKITEEESDLIPNDLIMYPSVPWRYLNENIAMLPEVHSCFKLKKAVEYVVEETYYENPSLLKDDVPAKLQLIRTSWGVEQDNIIWEDD